jgi:uncharacterized protein (DUF1697 family)
MQDLRELLSSLGHTDVVTYLQSGNAVFTSPRHDGARLAAEIEEQMAIRLNLDVTVLVRSRDNLARVVAANPLPEATTEPARLHVAFLASGPKPEVFSAITRSQFPDEVLRGGDCVVYIWYRNGVGRSKLTTDVLERRLGVRTTLRNWNTVTKLLSLA